LVVSENGFVVTYPELRRMIIYSSNLLHRIFLENRDEGE
jgi:hypothetical protein